MGAIARWFFNAHGLAQLSIRRESSPYLLCSIRNYASLNALEVVDESQ